MYLYKAGTQSSVLINQGVLVSEVPFKRGSTVYSRHCESEDWNESNQCWGLAWVGEQERHI